MTSPRVLLVAMMFLAPAAARAHGVNGHPADPNLHVGTGYDECFVKFAPELTQDAFHRFAREFGSVSAFKPMSSPAPLGRRGILLGIEQLSFEVEDKSDAWNDTFAHPDAYHELGERQAFPKATLRVGVTDRVDVGAFFTRNPNANYGWLGLDAKYGMLRQSETMPVSLAVRGAYTKTLYVDDMDMHTFTADATAGRIFWSLVTPYLGVGGDLVWVRETSAVVALHDETQLVPSVLGGAELRWWHFSLGAEAHVSALTSFQVQVAALF